MFDNCSYGFILRQHAVPLKPKYRSTINEYSFQIFLEGNYPNLDEIINKVEFRFERKTIVLARPPFVFSDTAIRQFPRHLITAKVYLRDHVISPKCFTLYHELLLPKTTHPIDVSSSRNILLIFSSIIANRPSIPDPNSKGPFCMDVEEKNQFVVDKGGMWEFYKGDVIPSASSREEVDDAKSDESIFLLKEGNGNNRNPSPVRNNKPESEIDQTANDTTDGIDCVNEINGHSSNHADGLFVRVLKNEQDSESGVLQKIYKWVQSQHAFNEANAMGTVSANVQFPLTHLEVPDPEKPKNQKSLSEAEVSDGGASDGVEEILPSARELLHKLMSCERCSETFSSIDQAFRHYKQNHYLKHCPKCFVCVSSLDMNFYNHLAEHFYVGNDYIEHIQCAYCREIHHHEELWEHVEKMHLEGLNSQLGGNGKDKIGTLQAEVRDDSACSASPHRSNSIVVALEVPKNIRPNIPVRSKAPSHNSNMKSATLKVNSPWERFNNEQLKVLEESFLRDPNPPWESRAKELSWICNSGKISRWFGRARYQFKSKRFPKWAMTADKRPRYDCEVTADGKLKVTLVGQRCRNACLPKQKKARNIVFFSASSQSYSWVAPKSEVLYTSDHSTDSE